MQRFQNLMRKTHQKNCGKSCPRSALPYENHLNGIENPDTSGKPKTPTILKKLLSPSTSLSPNDAEPISKPGCPLTKIGKIPLKKKRHPWAALLLSETSPVDVATDHAGLSVPSAV
jgi:hypothetical protein